jgi:hypothetical protein
MAVPPVYYRHPSDRSLVERAATRLLEFRGFVATGGSCIRCGKTPDGTGCLHQIYDPQEKELIEYGVYCFPTYIVPALHQALAAESDPARRQMLEANIARIPRRRRGSQCNVCKKARPVSERDVPVPPEECVGGGYDFVLQAVGRSKSFTAQVYDDELPLLGAALLEHDTKRSQDDIAAMEESELIRVAVGFCQRYLSDTQDKQGCRIIRFGIGHLANRGGAQPQRPAAQQVPELEGLFEELG